MTWIDCQTFLFAIVSISILGLYKDIHQREWSLVTRTQTRMVFPRTDPRYWIILFKVGN